VNKQRNKERRPSASEGGVLEFKDDSSIMKAMEAEDYSTNHDLTSLTEADVMGLQYKKTITISAATEEKSAVVREVSIVVKSKSKKKLFHELQWRSACIPATERDCRNLGLDETYSIGI
jgi:hypothetical protein